MKRVMMDKVKTIIGKEWAEVFKNRLVLFSVAFMPLIFVAMPLLTFGAMGIEAGDVGEGDVPPGLGEVCAGLTSAECLEVYMVDLFTLMFMILPFMIPVTIAAYSIVGEKTTRSLEPLLATPITTGELVLGKTLAAMIPAVGATYLAYLLYLFGMYFLVSPAAFRRLLDPLWLLAVFLVGPLLTVFSVCIAIMVSSRVSDPRVAEQLAGVVVLPLILILVGQSVGFIILNQQIIIAVAVVTFLVDVALVYLAIRLFQREVILTRWK
jgi:ABC-2 type transport system permease protein